MEYKIQELIDIEFFQELLSHLNDAFGFTVAIIDNDSEVLAYSGWQDVCAKYHRVNDISLAECKKSDQYILHHLCGPNESVQYKCPRGMIEGAAPIIIQGKHMANIIIGQLFLEEPDMEFFRKQARRFGFSEEEYLKSVSNVPIITSERLNKYLKFVVSIAHILANMGYKRLQELKYQEELEMKNSQLFRRLQQSINAISKIGELRDLYTAGHQKKVQELVCAISMELGLSTEIINDMSLGAIVHDIGKIYIASDTLNKPGKLTPLEYEILKTHATYSYEIVKEIDLPIRIQTMIYQHHERLDGLGYPKGISGDEIILESRILAVADVVDAMSSHRPYRPSLGIDAALEEIITYKGTKYDCEVADICVDLFRNKGFQFSDI